MWVLNGTLTRGVAFVQFVVGRWGSIVGRWICETLSHTVALDRPQTLYTPSKVLLYPLKKV